MPATMSIEQAQSQLPELIDGLAPGEEILLTRNQRPVARIVADGCGIRKPRVPGSAKGKLIILEEDDAHLRDFEEYMR